MVAKRGTRLKRERPLPPRIESVPKKVAFVAGAWASGSLPVVISETGENPPAVAPELATGTELRPAI